MIVTVTASRSRSRRLPGISTEKIWGGSLGTWVLFGVPIVLLSLFVWQVGSGLLRTGPEVRVGVSVSAVSLEADPSGSRIDLVVVDNIGQETTTAGSVVLSLREPDGAVWRTTRSVTPDDFAPLPDGGLLAGRLGFSTVVPASDWPRPPHRGGSASVSVTVVPDGVAAFSADVRQPFP